MYEGMVKMLMAQFGIDPVAMKQNMETAKIEYSHRVLQLNRIEENQQEILKLLQPKIGESTHE